MSKKVMYEVELSRTYILEYELKDKAVDWEFIKNEALSSSFFDEVKVYTENDLPEDLKNFCISKYKRQKIYRRHECIFFRKISRLYQRCRLGRLQ